jgi:hypothetical protein
VQRVNILADPTLYAAVVAMNSSDMIDPRSTATKPARRASETSAKLSVPVTRAVRFVMPRIEDFPEKLRLLLFLKVLNRRIYVRIRQSAGC